MAKTNYTFEKRQREIAKKKEQDEKKARKKAVREGGNSPSPTSTGTGREPSSG